ncbi:hypothetical protein L6R53_09985 [Myxococcota bacterium]|nr:hypothetical protein [Myxococcota bacterium]
MSRSCAMGYGSTADCGCGCSDRGWGGADVWPAERHTRSAAWGRDEWAGSTRARDDEPVTPRDRDGGGGDSWDDVFEHDGRTGLDSLGSGEPLESATWLVPPDEGSRGPCELKGSTSECVAEDVVRSAADIDALDVSAASDAIQIEGAEYAEVGLILRSWALLRANTELVRWAWCWVEGDADHGDCVVNHIEGSEGTVAGHVLGWLLGGIGIDQRLKIKVEHRPEEKGAAWATGQFDTGGGGTITLWTSTESPFTTRAMQAWTSTASSADRYCAVVDLACTLMHELAHVCWRLHETEEDDLPEQWSDWIRGGVAGLDDWLFAACDKTYVAENIFRWAMYRRYGFVLTSSCCPSTGNPQVGAADTSFGSDGFRQMSGTCNPYSSPDPEKWWWETWPLAETGGEGSWDGPFPWG